MTKKPQKQDIKDEPDTEERFLRGVRNIVKTPPKPFTPKKGRQAKPIVLGLHLAFWRRYCN